MINLSMVNIFILKRFLILTIAFALFLSCASITFASTLSLSPKTANLAQGAILPVQVKLNTGGESINGISSYLSYPQDKLEVVSIIYSSSAFDIAAENIFGGGTIKISRGSISGVNSSSATVATINFKGKSQGGTTVSFIRGSAAPRTINSAESLNLAGSVGGSYTVTGIDKTAAVNNSQSDDGYAIKDVLVTLISTKSATITWSTDKESDSTVEYGLQPDKYFLEAFDGELVKEHKVVIQGDLIPGETYHFRVKSKEGLDEGASKNMTFQLKGYSVRITVLDSKGNQVKDAQVVLYSLPVRQITDKDGISNFSDVSPTRHLVVVKSRDIETSKEIDVKEESLSEFTITLNPAIGNNNMLLAVFYGSLVFIVALIAVGVFILWKKVNAE